MGAMHETKLFFWVRTTYLHWTRPRELNQSSVVHWT